jgi:ATP-dependent DNA helicase RecG
MGKAKSLCMSSDASSASARSATSPAQKALHKLGLREAADLALHLPLRYEDETRITRLADARVGEMTQIEGRVVRCEVTFRPRRQLRVEVDDGTDRCVLRFLNFYPSHQKTLAEGALVRVRGELRGGLLGWEMVHPSFKLAGGPLPQTLTPVYPTVAQLPQTYLRKAVLGGLARADLAETLPPGAWPTSHGQAWTLRQSLQLLHQPGPQVSLAELEDRSHPAWQRLKAEELLAQQLTQLQARRARDAMRAPALRAPLQADQAEGLRPRLLRSLPFDLTAAQRRVDAQITADLGRDQPMHRLLQGDVGSGKTVVAALAALRCIEAGWQCVLMAPTEILAEQHFGKLVSWLKPLGVQTAWLTGSQKVADRRRAMAAIESGQAALVVGTHAVIEDKVRLNRLGLVIIDEQHRFGVAQRLALRSKMAQDEAGRSLEPHLLMMSATPIPRTLAMSYYADLDVSTIDELPPGRSPIVTRVVHERRREEIVSRIAQQLQQGRQVYWVCPMIEDSEVLDLRNATATHAELQAALPGHSVALLHSRMPTADKKVVMAAFAAGQTGVLVSTTVIEVGVDVPNASLMVIEHAERFGLSQLHQLRGRVGRGAAASACVLLYSTGDQSRLGQAARARLQAMAQTQDGFEIARRDLDIRGPGEFLGARQSGAPLLRFADLSTDGPWLEWARQLAPRMLEHHPGLAEQHVQRWLGGRADFVKA